MGKAVDWRGNFVAIVTPFTRNGEIAKRELSGLVEFLIREQADGIIATGCTGEFWALTAEERTLVHKLVVKASKGRVPVIAGVSDMLTDQVIYLGKQAKAVGVDGIMVTAPYYIRPDEEEVMLHFRRISQEVDLPILVYNIPKRVGISLSPSLLAKLAEIDNVVAVKQSSENFEDVVNTVRLCKDKIKVFAGHSVTRGLPCAVMGVYGFVSSVEPQILGHEAIRLFALSMSGELPVARDLQYRLIELDDIIHGIATFPAGLKAAMNMVGRPGGYPRPPLLPLSREKEERLRAALKRIGIL